MMGYTVVDAPTVSDSFRQVLTAHAASLLGRQASRALGDSWEENAKVIEELIQTFSTTGAHQGLAQSTGETLHS